METTSQPTVHALPRMLTRYRAWADEQTFAMAQGVSEDELLKQRPTTFGTIAHTLHHTLIVDEIFRAHLEGRSHGHSTRTADTPPPIGELGHSMRAMNAWWVDLADRLSTEDLGEAIEFRFVNGDPSRMTRLEIILHVVQHASYHRGYVDDMMYQIPVIPPATDLSVYLQQAG